MSVPIDSIAGCRQAHQKLDTVLGGMADDVARSLSLVTGWTVGHVLSHLARNTEAMHTRIGAALEGRMVEQYPGGAAGRAAMIEAGAGRPTVVIIDDVRTWSARLDEQFAALAPQDWERPVRTVAGGEHPVGDLPFRRWREVEVHLVDLGLSVTPADWPDDLVDACLPRLLASLSRRCDQRELMAWLFGRGTAPDLAPWA